MIDLYAGKTELINKYDLILKKDGYWYADKENSHEQKLFKDGFLQRNDLIIILFRIYKLCFGKVNYFRSNIAKYEPYKYHYQRGFVATELWDAEFFRHKKSGSFIDLRYLQSIKDIALFLRFVAELEMQEDETDRDTAIFTRLAALSQIGPAAENSDEL